MPVGYHFLMATLDYTCHLDHLGVSGEVAELEVEVACSQLKFRGGQPVQGQVDWAVRRAGRLAATGTATTRFTSPQVYRRMRGDFATPTASVPGTAPVPAARAGRTRDEDVVLSASSQQDTWRLRVDTSHPTLFQRPNDHVPGMLLLEAARQAACLVTGPAPFVPSIGGTRFVRYAEFDSPCWIQATVRPGPHGGADHRAGHRASGRQPRLPHHAVRPRVLRLSTGPGARTSPVRAPGPDPALPLICMFGGAPASLPERSPE